MEFAVILIGFGAVLYIVQHLKSHPRTSLFKCIENADLAGIEELLKTDSNLIHQRNKQNVSALFYAIIHFLGLKDPFDDDWRALLEKLIQSGSDVNEYSDSLDETPLIRSAGWDQMELTKFLMDKGADINLQVGENKISVLMVAAERSSLKMVELLLDHRAKKDLTDTNGMTAKDWVAPEDSEPDHAEKIRLLSV